MIDSEPIDPGHAGDAARSGCPGSASDPPEVVGIDGIVRWKRVVATIYDFFKIPSGLLLLSFAFGAVTAIPLDVLALGYAIRTGRETHAGFLVLEVLVLLLVVVVAFGWYRLMVNAENDSLPAIGFTLGVTLLFAAAAVAATTTAQIATPAIIALALSAILATTLVVHGVVLLRARKGRWARAWAPPRSQDGARSRYSPG